MEKVFMNSREREYAENRKLATFLLDVEEKKITGFRSIEKRFTEQEFISKLVRYFGGKISEKDIRENIHNYVGNEKYGKRFILRELALLRNDTLSINHVRSGDGCLHYHVFIYTRDSGIT